MIRKIVRIERSKWADDRAVFSWYDLRKPNLSALSEKGVSFILKTASLHLENGDILIAEDGYRILATIEKIETYVFEFQNALDFAKSAYMIGNRHQPIRIEDMKIVVLEDTAIADIVESLALNKEVVVKKDLSVFAPNVNSSHTH
ncbi:MAG: urease accessory protein UreE [Helicobacteraceae bacterium]|jgi:urease accessory protein|nr:urease accessory protein UreE [Helicobacteraceae bacterium]